MSEKLRILIVDDNEDFCRSLADILEAKGYEGLTAYDGFKALGLVTQNSLDLVLMDVKMSVMNGVETFKKLKKVAPKLPVIMMTAYTVEGLVREALQEGAFGFLRKPVDFDQLFTLIESAVSEVVLLLVVDDDPDLCDNMKDDLAKKGYRVCIATDGNTAIARAWESNFDIMLLDMNLPTMNGLETYLAIRDVRPNAVTIIITGYLREMDNLVEQTMKQGAYACLEKPIDIDALVMLLKQIEEEKAKGILRKPDRA